MTPKVWCLSMLSRLLLIGLMPMKNGMKRYLLKMHKIGLEVLERKATPNLTIFKTLSLDEQIEVMTQSVVV
jgi:hypothetical protein